MAHTVASGNDPPNIQQEADMPTDKGTGSLPHASGDESSHPGETPCLLDQANLVSRVFYCWVGNLIQQGCERTLTEADMPGLPHLQKSRVIAQRLKDCWEREKQQGKKRREGVTLLRAIFRCFVPLQMGNWTMLVLSSAFHIVQALSLGWLIRYFVQDDSTRAQGFTYAAVIVGAGLFYSLLMHHAFFAFWVLGLQLRISTTTLIYDKLLRLRLSSLGKVSTGYIINLATTDIERFQMAGQFFGHAWEAPLETIAILYFGIKQVGVSFLPGFGALLLLVLLQARFSKKFAMHRASMTKYTDERIKLTNQAITGARLMKISGWEFMMAEQIERVRALEIGVLLRATRLRAINEALFFVQPAVLSLLTFATYHYLGNTLTPAKVFTTLALLNIVQFSLGKYFYLGVQACSEAWISIKRLEQLLLLEEYEDLEPQKGTAAAGDGGTSDQTPQPPGPPVDSLRKRITVQGASFRWQAMEDGTVQVGQPAPVKRGLSQRLSSRRSLRKMGGPSAAVADPAAGGVTTDAESPRHNGHQRTGGAVAEVLTLSGQAHSARATLEEIDLDVIDGELVGVAGPVGSSKSSLLYALLQELSPVGADGPPAGGISSTVSVMGRVAYAAQDPWIQTGTLRDNVLFGSPMDPDRYHKVLRACALAPDLATLPAGDMTVIGDRGVNLSGGQKARVGLARMAYMRADIYIMDDPLSAVDPAVGRKLFSRVVCGLLAGRTRILVTHQIQYLKEPEVDRILLMRCGRIHAQGKYHQIQDLIEDIEEELEAKGAPAFAADEEIKEPDGEDDFEMPPPGMAPLRATMTVGAVEQPITEATDIYLEMGVTRRAARYSSAEGEGPLQTMPLEGKGAPAELVVAEDSQIGQIQWSTYTDYIKLAVGLGVAIILAGLLMLGQLFIMLINIWLARWSRASDNSQNHSYWVYGLAGLSGAAIVVSTVRTLWCFHALVQGSKRLHNRMLRAVVRAPVLFFDANPVGRILNKFSKDVNYLDDLLPMTLYDFCMCSLMCVGSILLVCIINPWVFLCLIPGVWWFWYLLRRYLKTSREVKRVEAVTRSPVYSFLSETIDGLVTIRAFGAQQRFMAEFHDKMDANTRAFFAFIFTARWLGMRLDFVVLGLLVAASFASVLVNEFGNGSIDPGLLGAGLVYVLQLGGLFQWAVRQAAEVENQMVSVERVLQYCRLDQEAPVESAPGKSPPDNWPDRGAIEVHNLWAAYRTDLPPVLKGVNMSIPGGSRVGIVGRTGAGKSSFVSVLFRLVEYDQSKGGIKIDGVPTSELGLHDLRPRMSVIPQTPFLFSGTVRLNMDPFGKYSDTEIWAALESVQMKGFISALPGGISALLTESGSNLSVGQRQLLCLARAILQRSRVLVMDESTANIDLKTDAMIQAAVRTKFQGCTVVMIAHRIATIINCDQVIVLSHGQVVEQDHPHRLLEAGGMFRGMVEDTGEATAQQLTIMAKDAWLEQQQCRNERQPQADDAAVNGVHR